MKREAENGTEPDAREEPARSRASGGIVLRPARPIAEEGVPFERYLDQASEGVVRFLFGKKTQEIVPRAFVQPGHDMSFEYVTFAERDGVLVGMASSFSAAEHRASDDGIVLRAAGIRRVRPIVLGLLGWPFFRFTMRVPDGDHYFQALAVDPAQRGAGIGSLLFEHVERHAAESGARRLCLDVAIGNEGARRLYARRGMVEDAISPSLYFGRNARVVRMVKPLSATPASP